LFATHVAFATHSGKAAMLANQLADDLQSSGIVASAVDQRDITLDTIAQVRYGYVLFQLFPELVELNACAWSIRACHPPADSQGGRVAVLERLFWQRRANRLGTGATGVNQHVRAGAFGV
jgi:hypothetical protein